MFVAAMARTSDSISHRDGPKGRPAKLRVRLGVRMSACLHSCDGTKLVAKPTFAVAPDGVRRGFAIGAFSPFVLPSGIDGRSLRVPPGFAIGFLRFFMTFTHRGPRIWSY